VSAAGRSHNDPLTRLHRRIRQVPLEGDRVVPRIDRQHRCAYAANKFGRAHLRVIIVRVLEPPQVAVHDVAVVPHPHERSPQQVSHGESRLGYERMRVSPYKVPQRVSQDKVIHVAIDERPAFNVPTGFEVVPVDVELMQSERACEGGSTPYVGEADGRSQRTRVAFLAAVFDEDIGAHREA
jgi:hypothetical protein